MEKKEKLECKVQTRITKTQNDKLEELNANLREVIDYYIDSHMNPTMELKHKQKKLLKQIKELENLLSEKKEELDEVNKKLGVQIDEDNASLEVVTIAERLKDNCQMKNNGKCNKSFLADYIIANEGGTILKRGIVEFGIREDENKEKFIRDVCKYLKINMEEKYIEMLLLQV